MAANNVTILEMVKNKGLVRFHLLQSFYFPQRQKLKTFIAQLMAKEKKSFSSLDYIFCSDEYLLGINKTYLNHFDLTDIITFDLSDGSDKIIGEIYISVERVKENASLFKTPFLQELNRVMFHGALHLCGYKDKLPQQKKEMRKKEEYYLSRFE